MLRTHRKSVLFNDKELEAISEYCRRFKVSSRSALIRQAVMERVLRGLEENHPTLF
ncbi:MAG: ribbon-helix-helix protein, CopG family [Bacteroidales bacterium]|nr:ribbon-helix-helix protein, CopG family [Bacteroidales bacterium]